MPASKKAFRAMAGISVYDNKNKEVKRYEEGDKIEDMTENELASEIEHGYVVEWSDEPPAPNPPVDAGEGNVGSPGGDEGKTE